MKKSWVSKIDWKWFRILSTICAFLINLFFINFLVKEFKPLGDQGKTTAINSLKKTGTLAMSFWYYIGCAQIGFSFLALVWYVLSKRQLIFREYWRKRFVDLKPMARAQKGILPLCSNPFKEKFRKADERAEDLLRKDPRDLTPAEFKDILKLEQVDKKNKMIHLQFEFESILCVIKDPNTLYSLFYLMVSLCGVFVFSLSYILHLFDVAVPLPPFPSHPFIDLLACPFSLIIFVLGA